MGYEASMVSDWLDVIETNISPMLVAHQVYAKGEYN